MKAKLRDMATTMWASFSPWRLPSMRAELKDMALLQQLLVRFHRQAHAESNRLINCFGTVVTACRIPPVSKTSWSDCYGAVATACQIFTNKRKQVQTILSNCYGISAPAYQLLQASPGKMIKHLMWYPIQKHSRLPRLSSYHWRTRGWHLM